MSALYGAGRITTTPAFLVNETPNTHAMKIVKTQPKNPPVTIEFTHEEFLTLKICMGNFSTNSFKTHMRDTEFLPDFSTDLFNLLDSK